MAPLQRPAFVLFCLLAFAVQTFTAQTHIHTGSLAEVTAEAKLAGAVSYGATSKDTDKGRPAPLRGDRANCPLCQMAVHAGTFLAPSIWIVTIPMHSVPDNSINEHIGRPTVTASYTWRSRAPPQA